MRKPSVVEPEKRHQRQGVTFVNDMKHPGRNYEDTMKLERGALEGRVQICGIVHYPVTQK